MPFKSKRAKIVLTGKDKEELESISKSRTASKARVERARMILAYSAGESINSIAKRLGTNRPKIERTVDRAVGYGALTALDDLPRKGATPKITREAKAWFLSIACTKPKELGLASEVWTFKELARYVRENCEQAGHPSLVKLQKGTVSKILAKSDIKPHKQSYYLEKKDPNFSEKTQVKDRHRSKEFVEYLQGLDELYPKSFTIKIILDNHSSHISKETKAYLKTVPNRFQFTFTPVHASWLNLIEVFFSKMTRSFLRGIRVQSKQELQNRILQYIDEVNQMPTVFTWKWKMNEISIA